VTTNDDWLIADWLDGGGGGGGGGGGSSASTAATGTYNRYIII